MSSEKYNIIYMIQCGQYLKRDKMS